MNKYLTSAVTAISLSFSAAAFAEETSFYTSASLLSKKMRTVGCDPIPERIKWNRDMTAEQERERDIRQRLVHYCEDNAALLNFLEAQDGNMSIAELLDFKAHEDALKTEMLEMFDHNLNEEELAQALSNHSVSELALSILSQSLQNEGYTNERRYTAQRAQRIINRLYETEGFYSRWNYQEAVELAQRVSGSEDPKVRFIGELTLKAASYLPNFEDVINALRAVPEEQEAERNLIARQTAIEIARHALDHAFKDRLNRHAALPGYYNELKSLLDDIPTGFNSQHYMWRQWRENRTWPIPDFEQASRNYDRMDKIHQRAYDIRLELERRGFKRSYVEGAMAVVMASAVGDPGNFGNPPGISRDERDWIALEGTFDALRGVYYARADYIDHDAARENISQITSSALNQGLTPE